MNQTIHNIKTWRLLFLLFFMSIAAAPSLRAQSHTLKGQVVSAENGEPLPAATIKIKNTNHGTTTDNQGRFNLNHINNNAVLVISSIGYATQEITPGDKMELTIRLKPSANQLDETVIRGYGTTTQRLNTGSISTITAKEISQQPVTNVLAALSGRMPGVDVQTQNGLPGGGVSIQIRGRNSISAGTDPLYVIDGVPYPSESLVNNTTAAANINGAVSPFSSLNPEDIASISVLKDADATAIYGSRGANGVILITTKKGSEGKTHLSIKADHGIRQVASFPKLLNLSQYLMIRGEAFINDQATPSNDPTSPYYAPDLTVWDTTKSTNWPRYLMGRTAQFNEIQASLSGGNAGTSFLVSGNYHTENTVLRGTNRYRRAGFHMNIRHGSDNEKFLAVFTASYNADNNTLSNIQRSLDGSMMLPPNFPLYDKAGELNWDMGVNPVAAMNAESNTETESLLSHALLQYTVLPHLNIKVSFGYNRLGTDITMTYPKSSQNPNYSPYRNYTVFNHGYNKTMIAEPQATYDLKTGDSKFNFLVGASYQRTLQDVQVINAEGYNDEALMKDLGAAANYERALTLHNEYKYISAFGRVTYNLENKYILDVSVRQDGSSRFGPGYRFGNFGAVGAAWLWGNEQFTKNLFPFISFGKLRGSYGITGNDQISDYQYLATYGKGSIYQDSMGLSPTRIANADFHWESNKKLELALEVGLFKGRILLTADRYWNHSGDQLVGYSLPYLTGFSYYQANLPAVVENYGWEIDLTSRNIVHPDFTWTTRFNLTLPKNKLKTFPHLSSSSYSYSMALGEPVTRAYGYRLTGIDPQTGIAQYATQPGSGSATPYYFLTIGNSGPAFYGGMGNTFTYKHWRADIFLQFSKRGMRGSLYNIPGTLTNNYTAVMDRWKRPGDMTDIPAASIYSTDYYYGLSSGNYFNVPYLRLKNVSLSYSFNHELLHKLKIYELSLYASAQNLLAWRDKAIPVDDPEVALGGIAPMRSVIAGLKITF